MKLLSRAKGENDATDGVDKPKRTSKQIKQDAKEQKKAEAIERKTKQAITYESSRIFQIEKSERRAWKVAFFACVLTAMSWVAIIYMLPLKTVEAFVIKVDESTGAAEVVTNTNEVFVSNSEVIDKYWVNKFIHAYESYDYYTIRKDYKLVGQLSTRKVGLQYSAKYSGEDAFDKVNLDKVTVHIDIESFVPTGKYIYTIRFRKITTKVSDGKTDTQRLIATVAFEYSNAVQMTASQRLANPVGFYVKSYRVDEEL